jgi:hypothetical protein
MAFEVAGATRERGATKRGNCRGCPPGSLAFAIRTRCCGCFSWMCARVVFLARVWSSSSSSSSFSFSSSGRHNGAGKAAQFGGAARIMQLGVHRGHAGCLPPWRAPARERANARSKVHCSQRRVSPGSSHGRIMCIFFLLSADNSILCARPGIYMALFASPL